MVGLANVPQETKVHAVYGKSLRGCRVVPARFPEDHWSFVQNVEEFGVGGDKLVENWQRARTFGRWLSKKFRISHGDVIGDAGLSNILFGPMPAGDPVVEFKPLEDTPVMLSPADHIIVASKDDFQQRSRKLVCQVAAEAAGGSLDTLVAGVN